MNDKKIKIISSLLLLVFLLSACQLHTEQETDFPPTEPINHSLDYHNIYHDYLEKIWSGSVETPQDSYSDYLLYDIDKDNIPELLVEYGTCEADRTLYVYTLDADANDHVLMLGNVPSGHIAFYSWPNDNGLMTFFGQMGMESISKLSVSNKTLQIEDIYTSPDELLVYDSPSQFAEGTNPVTRYYQLSFLPLEDYNPNRQFLGGLGQTSSENQTIFNELLKGQRSFYAVSIFQGDNYFEGETTLTDFIQPHHIDPYTESSYEVAGTAYMDVNGDQNNEMILKLENSDQGISYLVLSIDQDQIYGYYVLYGESYLIMDNGLFIDSYYPDEAYPWVSMLCYKGKDVYVYNMSPNTITNHQPLTYTMPSNS